MKRGLKKIGIAAAVVFLLSAFTLPKNKVEKCFYQATPFVVDGHTSDWYADSLRMDSKTGFVYALSNDDHFLFVRLKMLHRVVQRKALLTGFTLWIDPSGKGKHVLGIEYPKGRLQELSARQRPASRPAGSYNRQRQSAGQDNLTAAHLKMLNQRFLSEEPLLKGFAKAGIKNMQVAENAVHVVLQIDTSGYAVYEAKIPLKLLFTHPADYLSGGKTFSVLFETGYLQIDMSRMHRPGGMGGGRMGSGQQPGSSRMAMMQEMTDISRLKLKSVQLFQEK
jgi:hypothetical protein